MSADIQELSRRARADDDSAREELFARMSKLMLQVASRRLRDVREHEEVVQDALTIVHQKLDGLEPDTPVLAFAFTVLRNRIGDHYRRSDVRRRHLTESDPDAAEPAAPEHDSFERRVQRRQLIRRLGKAAGELSRDERATLQMLLEGEGAEAIAGRLGIKVGAARVRVHRLRTKLRRLLEAGGRLPLLLILSVT